MPTQHQHTQFAGRGLKHLQLCHGCVNIALRSAWRSTHVSAATTSVTSTTLTAALFLLGGLFLVCLESSWAWRCCHFSPSYTTTFKLPCFSATCQCTHSSAKLSKYKLSSQAAHLAAAHKSIEGFQAVAFALSPNRQLETSSKNSKQEYAEQCRKSRGRHARLGWQRSGEHTCECRQHGKGYLIDPLVFELHGTHNKVAAGHQPCWPADSTNTHILCLFFLHMGAM